MRKKRRLGEWRRIGGKKGEANKNKSKNKEDGAGEILVAKDE